MAISLEKKPRNLPEITPVHLLDEDDTISKEIASPVFSCTAIVADEQPKNVPAAKAQPIENTLGILEKEQALIDAKKEIKSKINQALVFKTKKDMKLSYVSNLLEKGHLIRFVKSENNYGLNNYNITTIYVHIIPLLKGFYDSYEIKFSLNKFDEYFEPDYEMSKLYSANPFIRLFRHKRIKAYLSNVREEILSSRKNEGDV